jgi:hypothetical protein
MPAGVALAVLLTRLPFLGPGLGTDNDAWSVGAAARFIARTGQYKVSRFPGFPVQEYAAALLWPGGPWLIDLASALMCAIAAALLAVVLRRAGSRDAALGAIAFAFVPTVFISSTSGMDYLWACALLLSALVLTLARRGALAGVALGLATGCRITSIAFLLPLALMRAAPEPRGRGRAVLALATPALLTAAAVFLPVALRYGGEFLSYYEPAGGHERSVAYFLAGLLTLFRLPFSPLFVAGLASVGVWGLVGFVALCVTIVAALARRAPEKASPMPRAFDAACGIAVAVSALLFLRLPDDEGYLIPALPFGFILLARHCPRRLFQGFCVAVLVSPFVLGVDVTPPKKGVSPAARSALARSFVLGGGERFVLDPLRGPLLMDRDKRRAQMDILARARAQWPSLPPHAVVIAGLLDLPLHVEIQAGGDSTCDILGREDLRALIAAGRPVFYFADAPERTERFFHYALDAEGARPFFTPARVP